MQRRAETFAVWSFVTPAAALVATWFAFQAFAREDAAGALAGVAVVDAVVAVASLILVSRSKPCRGWAVAGAVASVMLVLGAVCIALLATLIWVVSGLTF